MNQRKKVWMAAVVIALCTNAAVAVPMPDSSTAGTVALDASALTAFYGVSLATSPPGAVEDKAVWLAKVQGLIAEAPAWLQQNVLASKTRAEFAANIAILQAMQKDTLESSVTAAKSAGASSAKLSAQGLGPANLGQSNNLVYTALAPCRIMDTRNASAASGVQGPILGNVLKQIPGYLTAGQNWGQYGGTAASECGLSFGGANIYALALVITILNPNFSAYLGVSDSSNLSTVLSTVALNYTGGQGLSTMYIVPQFGNTVYFAMPAGLSANIIFDVVGYFVVSQPTALECVAAELQGTGTGNVANNFFYAINARAACPSSYGINSVACTHSGGSVPGLSLEEFGPGSLSGATASWAACVWRNQSGGPLNGSDFFAVSNCCRVPGR